eukprot:RCo028835
MPSSPAAAAHLGGGRNSLLFPVQFFHPTLECGTRTVYAGPYRSTSAQGYHAQMNAAQSSPGCLTWSGLEPNVSPSRDLQEVGVAESPKASSPTESFRERSLSPVQPSYVPEDAVEDKAAEISQPVAQSGSPYSRESEGHVSNLREESPEVEQSQVPPVPHQYSAENEELINHCTFRPRPFGRRGRRVPTDGGDSGKVFSRLYSNAQRLQREKSGDRTADRIKKLPFRPQITEPPAGAGHDGSSGTAVFSRLYDQGIRQAQQREAVNRATEEEMRRRLFRPAIEEVGAQSRYMEAAKKAPRPRSTSPESKGRRGPGGSPTPRVSPGRKGALRRTQA